LVTIERTVVEGLNWLDGTGQFISSSGLIRLSWRTFDDEEEFDKSTGVKSMWVRFSLSSNK
jgi:hypothetical protein